MIPEKSPDRGPSARDLARSLQELQGRNRAQRFLISGPNRISGPAGEVSARAHGIETPPCRDRAEAVDLWARMALQITGNPS